MSRPLEPEEFTKADSWAMVNFLLQFSEAGIMQISSVEGTEITKRFSYLLSAKLECVLPTCTYRFFFVRFTCVMCKSADFSKLGKQERSICTLSIDAHRGNLRD